MNSFVSKSDILLVKNSGLFDEQWYLETYKDVQLMNVDPVENYLWLGHRLGRSPSLKFCSPSYIRAYWDVKKRGSEPLLHYLKYGVKENRLIYPVREGNNAVDRQRCERDIRRHNYDWDWSAHAELVQRLESLPHKHSEEKISVIMPTYNRAHMISAAIQSVLEQTHRNFELIVVDDNSTDDTAAVVNALNDDRIIFTQNRRKKGVSGARNTGLDTADGKWVFFLDSDNVWMPSMIELMLKHAVDSQTSAGYCAANVQDDNQETKFILYSDFDFESCLAQNFIDLNCFFMRWTGPFREFRFDESLRRLVDWDFVLRVASRTRVSGVPYVGVIYYDGASERITNKEHVERESIQALMHQIRDKLRPEIVKPNTIQDSSAYRIAVHFHVYHPEIVPECLSYLRNICSDFDLFVSTSLNEGDASLELVRQAYPKARLLRYPNVGADIGPFLSLISTFKNYRLVLKIHTKRDVERWGDSWRKGLILPLLGTPELVDTIIERFRINEQLIMACSAEFYKHGPKNSIPPSLEQLEILAKQVDLSDYKDKDWAFVAGTMFWVRPHLYLKLALRMSDSEGYNIQFMRDGAIEHGLERVLGLALWQDSGNRIALISMDSELKEVGLGEGHTVEGVVQTMKRLCGQ